MFGSFPLSMLARTCLAIDSISVMVFSSRSLRVASELAHLHGSGLCMVRLLWSTSSSFVTVDVAFIIAEREDVLQGDRRYAAGISRCRRACRIPGEVASRGAGNARACVRIPAAPI